MLSIQLDEPTDKLVLMFIAEDTSLPVIASELMPVSDQKEVYTIFPTELEGIASETPSQVFDDEFDVAFWPAESTVPFVEELQLTASFTAEVTVVFDDGNTASVSTINTVKIWAQLFKTNNVVS